MKQYFSVFYPLEKWGKSQNKIDGGGGRKGRKETFADKPLDFENSVRQRMGLMIGWAH